MDVQTITMDRGPALEAFREYRDAVRLRHDDEDEAIMRGYRELARGGRLVRLDDVLRAGGVDGAGRPRLAVARADYPFVHLDIDKPWRDDHATAVFASADDSWEARTARAWHRVHRVRNFEGLTGGHEGYHRRATVPIVPPSLRPRGSLKRYHVLWEVEEWATRPAPPRDPYLLRRCGGDLWAVLAQWDLTDLERAVLAGRTDD